jgi:hypothetical protein
MIQKLYMVASVEGPYPGSRIQYPRSGIQWYLDLWIRDQDLGWEKIRIREKQLVSCYRQLNTGNNFLGIKIFKFFVNSVFQILIRDPGWKNPGPGSWIRYGTILIRENFLIRTTAASIRIKNFSSKLKFIKNGSVADPGSGAFLTPGSGIRDPE